MLQGLRRHQLAWLHAAGWQALLARATWQPAEHACLQHWADHALPLVVTRQPAMPDAIPDPEDAPVPLIALGLAAPNRWGRLRIGLQVPAVEVCGWGAFPALAGVLAQLPPEALPQLERLQAALLAQGLTARVHGSHGWQALSGLACTRAGSDLDLCVDVADAEQADAASAALLAFDHPALRLDGELQFADGRDIAWREWAAWRAGRTRQLLVRRIDGCALETAAPARMAAA